LHRVAFQALRSNADQLLVDKYRLNRVLSTRSVVVPVEVNSKPKTAAVWGNIQYTVSANYSIASRGGTRGISSTNADTTLSAFALYNEDTRGLRGEEWKPLPFIKSEMDNLKKLFTKANIPVTTLSGKAATEESFKALDGDSQQVLHMGTHGFFLPVQEKKTKESDIKGSNTFAVQQNPMFRSGLVLAGGNRAWKGDPGVPGKEDGILTAYDIAQMDLSGTDLVVLSACETALGDLQGNEGVIGLQRAFKMAGVKQIIVSLWKVNDKATAELMTHFYKNWLSGQTTREALHNAQLKLKEKKPSPYYWAAFVLVE
jgi:CHAT domain-containing protein